MIERPQNIRHLVQIEVNNILLNSTFADDGINPSDKISRLITFPEDIALIRERIKNMFKIRLNSDISEMTVNQLYTKVFVVVMNSESLKRRLLNQFRKPQCVSKIENQQKTSAITQNTTKEWQRRTIFSYIIHNIASAMGRSIQSNEKIRDLLYEANTMKMNYDTVVNCIKELENFFDIRIDQEMRIYNIGNAAEKSFIAQGKAEDSRTKYESMDPLWGAIHKTLQIKYLQDVLQRELNVRISTYKLLNVASYAELEQMVAAARQKKTNSKEH